MFLELAYSRPSPPLGRHSEVMRVPDHILLPVKARQITETAIKARVGCAWIIIDDDADYPAAVIARFATHSPSVYVMVAATLDELRAMLPPGLMRSVRQPDDPPGVVEIWFSRT